MGLTGKNNTIIHVLDSIVNFFDRMLGLLKSRFTLSKQLCIGKCESEKVKV